jgi:branched-chain amino acid transport system ATP-binding protein
MSNAIVRTAILEAAGLSSGYGEIPVLRDVNLYVGEGEVVALLGANGAGKSTMLRTMAGSIRPSKGEIRFRGSPIRTPLHVRARQGIMYIPEERPIVPGLSTRDNLRLGSGGPEAAYSIFPVLRALSKRKAGLLSGGEQQILALARAMATVPQIVLADEMSLGLAPLVVREMFQYLRVAADEKGVGVLLVEQQIRNVLRFADRAYVLQRGRIVLEGPAAEMLERVDEIEDTYMTNVVDSAAP